jgi:hypothetical protein
MYIEEYSKEYVLLHSNHHDGAVVTTTAEMAFSEKCATYFGEIGIRVHGRF